MTSYQVVRPFSEYELGAILTEVDFVNPHRATQLVDKRFLTRLTGQDGYQPTAQKLGGATIRQLVQLVGEVVDRGVLVDAISKEERETAIKVLEKRLAELEAANEQSN
ncbi:MAG TPA: hypothetical protein VLA24_17900 [Pseudomonadales bacterium]|nr:hypothetical protein [Pseudomonadales bacterium]